MKVMDTRQIKVGRGEGGNGRRGEWEKRRRGEEEKKRRREGGNRRMGEEEKKVIEMVLTLYGNEGKYFEI